MSNIESPYRSLITSSNIRLEVFKEHWNQTVKIMEKDPLSYDDAEPVIYYMEQMVALMLNDDNPIIPLELKSEAIQINYEDDLWERDAIFFYCLDQDLFNKVHNCSTRFMGEILEKLKRQQLRMFTAVVEQGPAALLQSEFLFQPLLRLLHEYCLRSSRQLELELVRLLHVTSVRAANDPQLNKELWYYGYGSSGGLPLLYPLIPFFHREGELGQEARDTTLLLLSAVAQDETAATAVALQSDFCPVLATGLSALYSALPRRICSVAVFLGQIPEAEMRRSRELLQFLDYLEFCCQVNKVTHPLIREAVVHYIYNGFLLPVLGASLNQSSLEGVTTATIYMELFLRSISDSVILKAFLCFLVAETHDEYRILNSLVNRINYNSELGVATISLLNTMLSFKCEDIMFEIVFKYLIPLNHLSQDQRVSISSRKYLEDSVIQFFNLRLNWQQSFTELSIDYLDYARKNIENCHTAVEKSWHFDFNGVNPSADYLNKLQLQQQPHRPFHGFLDHYSQLLEMRDAFRHVASAGGGNFYQPNIYSQYDDNMKGINDGRESVSSMSMASFKLCPFSPASQRSNSDTITSMKTDTDSVLDRCLHKLRYPSKEDLLEHKSHYMISYNIMDYYNDAASEYSLTAESPNLPRANASVSNSNSNRHLQGFDLVRNASPDGSDVDDLDIEEHINEDEESMNIDISELKRVASCEQMDEFMKALDDILIDEKSKRNYNFSLEDVLASLKEEENNMEDSVHKPQSPANSVLSIQSAITLEDDMLRYSGIEDSNMTENSVKHNTGDSLSRTLGFFLYAVLDRLEHMPSNSPQINITLSGLLINLLSFPHPLLRNYLLDTSPITNDYKCLYQVMGNIRSKLEDIKTKLNHFKDDEYYFQNIVEDCKRRMMRRYQLLNDGDFENNELHVVCGNLPNSDTNPNLNINTNTKRHFSILQFLSRKSITQETVNKSKSVKEDQEKVRHLNAGYATIIFDDLCHEISAFAKEHSVFFRPSSFGYANN